MFRVAGGFPYLSIKVTHLLQRHVGPLVHVNDLFIRNNTEASAKIQTLNGENGSGLRLLMRFSTVVGDLSP